MNDAAVSTSSPNPAQESPPDDPEDPGASRNNPAARGMGDRRPPCLYPFYSQVRV